MLFTDRLHKLQVHMSILFTRGTYVPVMNKLLHMCDLKSNCHIWALLGKLWVFY